LEQIVRTSDTTEMPTFLDEQWAAVMSLLESVEGEDARQLADIAKDYLRRWYRRHRHL